MKVFYIVFHKDHSISGYPRIFPSIQNQDEIYSFTLYLSKIIFKIMRIRWTIAFLLLSFVSFSQKTLTLSDAVLQQYRNFYPEHVAGFSWIPGTTEYTYLDQYTKLVKGTVGKEEATTILEIQQLNEKAGVSMSYFAGFSWLSKTEFTVTDGQNFVLYNVQDNTAKSWLVEGENALMNWNKKAVAYTKENNVHLKFNGQDIGVTNHTSKEVVSGQAIARSEFGISGGLFWSESGNFLAFYEKDESEVHNYPLLDITKTPGELNPIKYPMAGQKSEKPAVGIFDLSTKKLVYIHPKGDKDDYLTNVAFSKDEKYLAIAELNRDQNHLWLNLYDVKTGAFVRTLFEEQHEKWVEPEFPPYFLNEANDFAWISERNGFQNLYLYDINGKLKKQLTNNSFPLKSIVNTSPKGDMIYFTATGPKAINTLVYKVDLKGKQTLLTAQEGTHDVIISGDGNYFFDQYSSVTIPNIAAVFDKNGKEIKRLVTGTNKLSDYKIGKTVVQTIPVNGIEEYARIIYPSDFDSTKKYPVLVYVYGGPHAQMITNSWYAGSSLWMNWMAEQGYIIFTVDNRGSANRGFAFENIIHRELGKYEMEDQTAALEWLKQKPYIDGNRIAVHGWSFGGFMTTNLLLTYPDLFKVGVAGGPVTDWNLYEVMYGERYMDRPDENPEGYKNTMLSNKVKNIKGKLLLIHGTADDVVVMQHNLSLVKAFVEAGKQVDFFPYPMHPHNVRGKDRVHLMEKVLNYILEYNK